MPLPAPPGRARARSTGSLDPYLAAAQTRLPVPAASSARTTSAVVKTVILAGGLGTRLAEETEAHAEADGRDRRPPILWHIMKIYARHGFNEFVVALGYQGDVVKNYFLNYYHLRGDSRSTRRRARSRSTTADEDWRSISSTPASRRRPAAGSSGSSRGSRRTFMLTYGDGVADVDIASWSSSTARTASSRR